MTRTPLQLERYFFPRLSVQALVYDDELPEDIDSKNIDVEGAISVNSTPNGDYILSLDIKGVNAEGKRLPYQIGFEVVGFFTVDKDFTHENIQKLVKFNGSSLLYSAARELILMVTGRGPWGEFQLPTINFQSAISDLNSAETPRRGEVPSADSSRKRRAGKKSHRRKKQSKLKGVTLKNQEHAESN